MKVTPDQVNAILRTLPVGYYCGTRAPVVLDQSGRTSCVDFMTRQIRVSFRNVAEALAPLPAEAGKEETEEAIRNELYHETAHLILTPREGLHPTDPINVLEDERIETLLRNYFHGVKFRDSIRQLNGYTGANWRPANPFQFLFGIARFRHGPRQLIDELDAMIANFSGVNCASDECAAHRMEAAYMAFVRRVYAYWSEHEEEITAPPPPPPPPPAEDGQSQPAPPPPAEDGEEKEDGEDSPGNGATKPGDGDGKDGDGEDKPADPDGDAADGEKPDGEDAGKDGPADSEDGNAEDGDDGKPGEKKDGDGDGDGRPDGADGDGEDGDREDGETGSGDADPKDGDADGDGADGKDAGKDGENADGKDDGEDGKPGEDGDGDAEDGEKDADGADGKDGDGEEDGEKPEDGEAGGDGAGAGKTGNTPADPDGKTAEDEAEAGRHGGRGRNETKPDGVTDEKDAAPDPAAAKEPEPKAPALDGEALENAKRAFSNVFNSRTDQRTEAALSRIILAATRRKSHVAKVTHAHTGRVDPRAVATRQDYRWFTRAGGDETGRADRINLRLWVDCSGSMDSAMDKVNGLIASLAQLERTIPDKFRFCVILSGEYTRPHPDKTKEVEANEGNDFGPGVLDADRKTVKSGWKTVNVCVWDGWMLDAWSWDPGSLAGIVAAATKPGTNTGKAFQVLNNRNTVIVSDTSNKLTFDTACPLARREYIHGNGYVEHFTEAVIKLLGRTL